MKRLIRNFGIIAVMILFPAHTLMSQGYIDVVVIDAGHGGGDPGAIGSLYKEKDIVLDIALKVGRYIEENCEDVKVIYTRKTDKFLQLWKRTDIANKNEADLFISIHANSSDSKQPYGTETFVMGPSKSEDNLKVAKQENASILLEDNYKHQYDGFDPNSPEAHIIFSLYQSTYLKQSVKMAEKIQYQFRERVKRRDRGVKQNIFLVLWKATMPAILVETGFLSNPAEEKYLGSEQGQAYIASAIYRAFKEYKKEMESGGKPVASTNEQKETKEESTKQQEENDIIFAVQFAISNDKKDPGEFKKVRDAKRYDHNGIYKFYTGNERSLNDAVLLQHKIQKLGYKDAFVIAFKNGERISVNEASKLVAQ